MVTLSGEKATTLIEKIDSRLMKSRTNECSTKADLLSNVQSVPCTLRKGTHTRPLAANELSYINMQTGSTSTALTTLNYFII